MPYIATFDKIGRTRVVAPLEVAADDPTGVAEEIHRYARRHLLSSEVEVEVDLDACTGQIIVGGFRPVGTIALVPMSALPEPPGREGE
jgi:hypothetical protein